MDPHHLIAKQSALTQAFEKETIWTADEASLRDYLRTINLKDIPNEYVRHQAITRALTINHIQMARVIASVEATMTKLNAANDKTQGYVTRLTVLALFIGLAQIVAALLPLFDQMISNWYRR